MRLKDRTAVVTGAGSGIGRASALLFAREGAFVALVDRDEAGMNETLQPSVARTVRDRRIAAMSGMVISQRRPLTRSCRGMAGSIC